MKTASRIISWLFVPLLTPIYGLMIAMYVPSQEKYQLLEHPGLYELLPAHKNQLLFMYFMANVVIPLFFFSLLKFNGRITTVEIDDRRERGLPLIMMFLTSLMLYLSSIYLIDESYSKFLFAYPLAGVFASVAYFFLNRWKKVSLHGGGVGIMTGFIFAYVTEMQMYESWILWASIIVSGLVCSARIYLEKHTLLEIVVGWFTGALITFAVNYFY